MNFTPSRILLDIGFLLLMAACAGWVAWHFLCKAVDPAKLVNLAQICERYGGGGHARVGAISFPPDQEEKARVAAAEIVAELRAKNPVA